MQQLTMQLSDRDGRRIRQAARLSRCPKGREARWCQWMLMDIVRRIAKPKNPRKTHP